MEKRLLARRPIGNPRRAWRQDNFVISTFSFHGAHENIRLAMENLKAAGFNLVEFGWLPEEFCDVSVAIAEEVGVDVLVQNWKYFGGFQNTRETVIDEDRLRGYIEKLKKYRHVYGYYVWDEPYKPDDTLKAARQTDIIAAMDPERCPFSVAIPSYNDTYRYENGLFDGYLERYVNEIDPPVMSLDYYPFAMHPDDKTQLDGFGVYKDLYLMRKWSLEKQLPLWFYYQGTPELGECTLTGWQMEVQVNLALLYGAKAIQHYTAAGCVLDADCSRGDYFDITRNINRRLAQWGRTLMALTSTGVFHSADVLKDDDSFRERYCDDFKASRFFAGELDNRVSVGEFTDEYGNDYAIVLNRDYVRTREIHLQLISAKRVYEVSGCDGIQKVIYENTGDITFTMKPGQARLIRLQDAAEEAYLADYILEK